MLFTRATYVTSGTADEIAEELGIDRKTVLFYSTPAYKKRIKHKGYQLINLKGIDDDE
jgi:hypothetical protein